MYCPNNVYDLTLRELKYRLFSWRHHPALTPSAEPVDVVIPVTSKDLISLPLCVEGIKKCVRHTIKAIYVVAPAREEITSFCKENNLIFVDELSVFGYAPQTLGLKIGTRDRSGWLFQQFVKLSGAIGSCRYCLCIDADHILIHPHVFLTKEGKTVFYMSYENHMPYYQEIERLLPGLPLSSLSYVDHKMLFDKEQLKALHNEISKNHRGKPWQQAILDTLDRNTHSGFSEFETYGNFVQNKELRPWLQKRLPYKKMTDYASLQKKYSPSRWSLTFPDYMRQNKSRESKLIDASEPVIKIPE